MNLEKHTIPTNITVRLLKTIVKEKILKADREKCDITLYP